jgi:diguanylate cyclase (GGDEF)-like protein
MAGSETPRSETPQARALRAPVLRAYETAVVLPLFVWIGISCFQDPQAYLDWRILVWAGAIAAVDLMPIKGESGIAFSLSFPIELSAALVYAPKVAAVIAFLGAIDRREFKGELPPLKALYIRGQIGWSVALESLVFHSLGSLDGHWYMLGLGVLLAAIAGYSLNVLVVAGYASLQTGTRIRDVVRELHVGVFGEFVISYMGLAFFSVLVALSTQSSTIGLWALVVFIAPLAFARQMFQRTHSLQKATDELAVRQAENEYQALHDALTGLPNRVLFQQHLVDAIQNAESRGGSVAVMLMDLDHFKEINDTLGHHFGDQLLREIGPRLSTVLREHDVMARLGGDEFGILLPDIPDQSIALGVASRLLEELERPVVVEGLALDVSGSIGVSLYPEQSANAESLLRRADVAMYAAKEAGGGFELYSPEMDQHSPAQLTLVSRVRPALDNGEMVMFYQPKVGLSDGLVSGAEALIRWHHPEHGLVPPDEFIPLVEKTVLLRPLTAFVLATVLEQWRTWADRGIRLPVAVNISPRSLLDIQLPEQIVELLERWEVPHEFLTLELTENFLMTESRRSADVLDELAAIGVRLSIDDFGTGYSSLSHLKRLKVDEIKVDRSFVMQLQTNADDSMIVRGTVELGRIMGLRVVAEGVEDQATLDQLTELGCDEAQGYLISRPLSTEDFDRWLTARTAEAIALEPLGQMSQPGRARRHVP